MQVLSVAVLPGHVMPLGVLYACVGRIAHNTFGAMPRVQIHQCLVRLGTAKMYPRGHASVGGIDVGEVQLPNATLGSVISAADVPEMERLFRLFVTKSLERSAASNPRFNRPLSVAGL